MNGNTSDRARSPLGSVVDHGATSILMVEDNPDHILLARGALERCGFWLIDVATCMADAFAKMQARRYHVLLVDYCLPDGYGIDLLDWVGNDCTVVMMTAQGNEKVAAEAFKRGALDYVVKDSLFREVLPDIVEQAVAKNMAMKQAAADSNPSSPCCERSATAYSRPFPALEGYVHTDHLRSTLSKVRRHLVEIRGCLSVIRYNPEEPVTENQLGFLESALDNCEMLDELIAHLLRNGTNKSDG